MITKTLKFESRAGSKIIAQEHSWGSWSVWVNGIRAWYVNNADEKFVRQFLESKHNTHCMSETTKAKQ